MKNYTNLSVMKSSEAEALETYKEESVEESQFETKKPYLYKGYEVPKNAQMLKFRYYTPENTLIEQNNVPYVYDGTSITDVINYYYLSDSNTVPIFNYSSWKTDGWTKEAQTVTAKKRYLWCITETRFSNTPEGVCGNLTGITLSSVYGEQGERGAMYLGHYVDSQACYEDNKPAVFTGDYYLNTKDSYIYVYDEESNLWAKITDFSDYRYNQSINDIFEAIESSPQKETFIKAKKIWVQNIAAAVARTETLFSNKITLTQGTDLDGKSADGIIQSANYASGKSGWKIGYDGNAEFNNATVRGILNGFYIEGSSNKAFYIDTKKHDLTNLDSSISIGEGAYISGQSSIAIGSNANCTIDENGQKNSAIAIGDAAQAKGQGAIAMGFLTKAHGSASFAIGYNAEAYGSLAIGQNAIAGTTGLYPAIAIGIGSKATESASTAIGYETNASATSVAIGYETNASATSVAIGYKANASATSTAIGYKANASATAVAIGYKANAESSNTIAIGNNAKTNKNRILDICCDGYPFHLLAFYFNVDSYSTIFNELKNYANVGKCKTQCWGGTFKGLDFTHFSINEKSTELYFWNNDSKVLTITDSSTILDTILYLFTYTFE